MSNQLPDELHFSLHTEFIEEAEDLFIEAKDILFDVNNWAQQSGLENIYFTLIDVHRKELRRKAHTGDYIKINKNDADSIFFIDLIEYDDYPDENKESFALFLTTPPVDEERGDPVLTLIIERTDIDLHAICYFEHDDPALILTAEDIAALLKSYLLFY